MNVGIALRNLTMEMKSYSSNKSYNPILINVSFSKELAYLPLILIMDSDFDIQSKLNNIRLSGIITLTKDVNFKLTVNDPIVYSDNETIESITLDLNHHYFC